MGSLRTILSESKLDDTPTHDPWVKPILCVIKHQIRQRFPHTDFTISLYRLQGKPSMGYTSHSRIRISYPMKKEGSPHIDDVFSILQTAVGKVCFEKSFDLDVHTISVRGVPQYLFIE